MSPGCRLPASTHWDLRRVIDLEGHTGMAHYVPLYFRYALPDRCLETVTGSFACAGYRSRMPGSHKLQTLRNTPFTIADRLHLTTKRGSQFV